MQTGIKKKALVPNALRKTTAIRKATTTAYPQKRKPLLDSATAKKHDEINACKY
jgi:hypothetical protein